MIYSKNIQFIFLLAVNDFTIFGQHTHTHVVHVLHMNIIIQKICIGSFMKIWWLVVKRKYIEILCVFKPIIHIRVEYLNVWYTNCKENHPMLLWNVPLWNEWCNIHLLIPLYCSLCVKLYHLKYFSHLYLGGLLRYAIFYCYTKCKRQTKNADNAHKYTLFFIVAITFLENIS